MNISEAAARAGLPPKTIRYYEQIGLVTPLRDNNRYRTFRETDVHKLGFLGRARPRVRPVNGFPRSGARPVKAGWATDHTMCSEAPLI